MASVAGRRNTEPETPDPAAKKRGSLKGGAAELDILNLKWFGWMYSVLPAALSITLALYYLRTERWQESLQWAMIGVGLGAHALPGEVSPFGKWTGRVSIISLAAGASLFGYWAYEQFTRG